MTHHALINVKPPKLPPHTLAFAQPVPGSVLCQLEVLSVHQVGILCKAGSFLGPGRVRSTAVKDRQLIWI